ncbi:TPA: hypothetical protein QCH65_004459, partial [Enterobacter roggenkampii]|nr:hypothetical protein [Enterobacter roggenkampii]
AATIKIKKNKDKVKIGEAITLQIEVKDKDGKPIENKELNAVVISTTNRQNESTTGAALLFNGKTESLFVTDGQGMVNLSITDPNGKGVKRTIEFSADEIKASTDVIFTVLTSPDTPAAKMWGHMDETFTTSSGVVFKRPKLVTEFSTKESLEISGEKWALAGYTESISICDSEEHIPTRSDFIAVKDDNVNIAEKG